MRTTCKMYHFCFHFDKALPGIAENGIYKTRCSCRSLKGAENFARKHAEMFSEHMSAPIKCVIEYNTSTGKKRLEITF